MHLNLTEIKEQAEENLRKYWKLLFPFELDENEYVRVIARNAERIDTKYLKNVDQLIDFLNSYQHRYKFHVLISLSTTDGKGGDATHTIRRSAIAIDFDKKNFTDKSTFRDFVKWFIQKTGLRYNMAVDSGNGYHFYIAINPTSDIETVANVTKAISSAAEADIQVAHQAQTMRLPTSMNIKDIKQKKFVNIIYSSLDDEQDKRIFDYGEEKDYDRRELSYLADKFNSELQKINNKIEETISEDERLARAERLGRYKSFLCVGNMIANGAKKGKRNFCLGRIIAYFKDVELLDEREIYETVQEWNERCYPPKSDNELQDQFRRYWEKDYNLLGCKIRYTPHMEILQKYCDKEKCKDTSRIFVRFDEEFLETRWFRNLTANHYLVLITLKRFKDGLTIEAIRTELVNRQANKQTISNRLIENCLNDLAQHELITFKNVYRIKNFEESSRYFVVTLGLVEGLIAGKISNRDLMVYYVYGAIVYRGLVPHNWK